MRHFLLIVTLLAAKCAIPALSQCTCDKANMVTNEGTAQQNFTWAPITFTEANGGCDLIATCHGISPLSFGLYYSSTADGNSPVLDADNAATLTFEDGSEAGQIHNFEFKYMRCVNGDWMVYMDDSGYLAENDPNGDPTMWFAYNNLFCEQADIPVVSQKIIGIVSCLVLIFDVFSAVIVFASLRALFAARLDLHLRLNLPQSGDDEVKHRRYEARGMLEHIVKYHELNRKFDKRKAICLICSVPIFNSNLGIDSCRACAVFYRRHLNDKELRCRKGTNDCIEKNVRPLCRKCRFMKFAAVLGENTPEHHQTISSADSDAGSSSSEDQPIHQSEAKPQMFIDHRSFNLFSSITEKSSLFERMKKAYSMLCFVRNCGEQGILDKDVSNALQGDGQLFYPANYGAKLSSLAILKSGLIQFCESVFEDFSLLPQDSMNCIIEKSAVTIQSLDGIYRAIHHFPGMEILTPTYSFYVNSDIIENFEDEFAFNNLPEIVKEMKDNFYIFLDQIRVSFERIKPANEEFLAMVGLVLCSSEATEHTAIFASKYRSCILSELHKFYATQGIVDYSARLGEIFCLLESIEKTVERAEEGISMINLMNSINLQD